MPSPLPEQSAVPNASGQGVSTLVEALVRATSFSAGAEATLGAMLATARGALTDSPFARTGRLLRAVIHLRPCDGYRGLVVLEAGAAGVSAPEASAEHLSSTTAWRWIASTRRAVSIDVNVGRVAFLGRVEPAIADPMGSDRATEFEGSETRLGLIAREVTHLLVLPLRGRGDAIDGMVSVEAACRPAIGTAFMWDRCVEALQLMVDLAGPHLERLPLEAACPPMVDPLLPVVGPSMTSLARLLGTFAEQAEPILIAGPTGSGKSRLARWCHERSRRRGKPFEVLDLCAVPETLQAAELFGWKRGAFTDASRDNPGAMARAAGGTVFIDEIDNLSLRAQAGLLHVLEEKTYRRLGDDGCELRADVRFIVGTNANLQAAVREKRFRQDLYYRIHVLPVKLPPLKERRDEIGMWAQYMANRRHADGGRGDRTSPAGPVSISNEAEGLLLAHEWPGNLRQLDNVVRRAYAIALMNHGGRVPAALVLEAAHVRRAMAYEESEEEGSVLDPLVLAALAFVREAERRGPGVLDLDLAHAFKGMVLAAATEKFGGDRQRALALFGREKLAKNRNHHKVLRREMDRAEQLCRALGGRSVPFAGIAEEKDPVDDPQAPLDA